MHHGSRDGATSPRRLDVFGDSLLGQLRAVSRKRKKREASKKRRRAARALRHCRFRTWI